MFVTLLWVRYRKSRLKRLGWERAGAGAGSVSCPITPRKKATRTVLIEAVT